MEEMNPFLGGKSGYEGKEFVLETGPSCLPPWMEAWAIP
jgi:hypothetical protein